MGRPRLHPILNTLAAIMAAGTIIVTIAAPVAAMEPWQKSWGDYDTHHRWHDAGWWLKNRHHWVTVHHPEWTDNYTDTFGRIGDSDRLHVWHYGDGGFDRHPNGSTAEGRTGDSKA
jgi:hypothetical protein